MIKVFVVLFVDQPLEKIKNIKNVLFSFKTKVVLGLTSLFILIMGLLPHMVMENIAKTSTQFLGVHELETTVNYFSLANIKGALISISIGLIIYFVIGRCTIISKTHGYINFYNKNISIENMIYRPIIMVILPNVFGFISRIFDIVVDLFVYLFNKIFVRDSRIPKSFTQGKHVLVNETDIEKKVSITKSLEYSLLLFGIGFMVIMIYLLAVN